MQLDDLMKQLSTQASPADIEHRKTLVRNLRRLENDPAWVYICRVIKDQITRLHTAIATQAPEDIKGILAQQRERGMAEAYEVLSALPTKLQEDLIMDLELTEEEVKDL
jgi:hypothetical protein